MLDWTFLKNQLDRINKFNFPIPIRFWRSEKSLRNRTRPRGSFGLVTLRNGESSSHPHSLPAMVIACERAAK